MIPGRPYPARAALMAALLLLAAASCAREERSLRPSADASVLARGPRENPNHAGPDPESVQVSTFAFEGAYDPTAYDLNEGKVLYQNMNCVGCHGMGGGGMGPPLMDATWIYGADPRDIYTSIVTGRPNGMPSFEGRLPAYQVWQLVAYVRSLSGFVPKTSAPGRSDDMWMKRPENSMDRPEVVVTPQGTERAR
jgi:cytochrome c oxidase cbb3-type subunit 3